MRYRIENNEGRVWDSTTKRWNSLISGDYNTYKSEAQAIAAASKTKAIVFWASEGNRVTEDK